MESDIVQIDDRYILIKKGNYQHLEHTFSVREHTRFAVAPAPIVWMKNESLKLSPEVPQGFSIGTRLTGPNAQDINALDSLIPSSLTLRKSPDGVILEQDVDYLLSAPHALLGIGPNSCVTPEDTVFASYAYAMMRIDSIFVDAEGSIGYASGIPHITTPESPHIPETCMRLVNIFCPYQATSLELNHIYAVMESADAVYTGSLAGRIPKTLRKLKNGERVVIVCWGDSVTAGGNASEPRYRYTEVFANGLRCMFPQAQIEVHNISVGGSSSVNWLYPEQYPFSWSARKDELDFNRITMLKPDLVTLEFVNDVGLEENVRFAAYEEIRHRLLETASEWILITPHFTHPSWMGIDMRGNENRPYVSFLKDYAGNHHLGLADASARWGHLWKEGIPYLTLLHNSVNHPENRGHRMFAEELWKCFAG